MTTKKNRIQFFIYILGTIIISVCVSNWLANKSNLYIKILMPKGGVTDPERQSRDTTKMSVADPFSNLMNSALHARTLLPEVHITIASVIQGATIVIIAEKIYSNSSLLAQGSLLDVLTFSTYAFASFLISILFWTRFIHGALLTYRSLTYVSNSIFFLLAISQMLTFYNIENPPLWSFWGTVMAFIAAILHWYTWGQLKNTEGLEKSVRDINQRIQRRLGVQTAIVGALCFLGMQVIQAFEVAYPYIPFLMGCGYVTLILYAIVNSHRGSTSDPASNWVYHGGKPLDEVIR